MILHVASQSDKAKILRLADKLNQNLFDGFDWKTLGSNEGFILLICLI